MSWQTIAEQLANKLKSVAGIGRVYSSYDPATDVDQLLADLESGKDINAWFIYRVGVSGNRLELPRQNYSRLHSFQIRGYLSRGQGSYKLAQDLMDRVFEAFAPPGRLTGLPDAVIEDIPTASHSLGSIAEGLPTVHIVDVSLVVKERLSIP